MVGVVGLDWTCVIKLRVQTAVSGTQRFESMSENLARANLLDMNLLAVRKNGYTRVTL